MRMSLLAALLLSVSTPAVAPITDAPDLAAIRLIQCDEGNGSGFLIGDDILVTANHVASEGTNCRDKETGESLTTYHVEADRDFAIMTGKLPDVRYLRYDCKPYSVESKYTSYGYSSYQLPTMGFQMMPHRATGDYFHVIGTDHMAELHGYARPGNSGGPIIRDGTNVVTGMVNAGALSPVTRRVMGVTFSVELRSTILCD